MDYFGTSLLHIAAECGYIDIAVYLLDSGANINATNTLGQTPLHFAVMYDKLEMVKLLHKKKANINKTDVYVQGPLDTAINNDSEEIINFLKENGAKKGLELAIDTLTDMSRSKNTKFSDIFKSLMTILCNPQDDRMCKNFLEQVDNLLSCLNINESQGGDDIILQLVNGLLACHLSKEQISTAFVASQKILAVLEQFPSVAGKARYSVTTLQAILFQVMDEQCKVKLDFRKVDLSLVSSDLVDSGSFDTLEESATTYCQQLVAEKKAQEELSSSSEAIPISQKNADVNSPIKTGDSMKINAVDKPIVYIKNTTDNILDSSDDINRDNSNPAVLQKKEASASSNKESSFWSKLGRKSTITVVTALVFGAAGFVFGGPALAIVAFGFGLVAGGVAAVMAGDDPAQMSPAEAKSIFSEENPTIQNLDDDEARTVKSPSSDAQLKNQVASTFETFFTHDKVRPCMGDDDSSKDTFLQNTLVCHLLDAKSYEPKNGDHELMFNLLKIELKKPGSLVKNSFEVFKSCFPNGTSNAHIQAKFDALNEPTKFLEGKFPATSVINNSSPINIIDNNNADAFFFTEQYEYEDSNTNGENQYQQI